MKTRTLIIVLSALVLGVVNISLLTSEKNSGYILETLSKIAFAEDEGSHSPSDPVWKRNEIVLSATTTYYNIPCSGGGVKHCAKTVKEVDISCQLLGFGVSCYPGPATTSITLCGNCSN